MKIGIDASNIRLGGGLTHLKEIVRFVDIEKNDIEKIVIWSSKKTLNVFDERPWLKKCSEPVMEQNYFKRALWQYKKLNKRLMEEKCDILFVPGGSFITKFRPVVTMSQNLIPFELKELYRHGMSLSTIRLFLLRLTQSNSFINANGTIFLTNYAKDTVLKVTGILKGETAMIPHGIDESFFSNHVPKSNNNNLKNAKHINLLYVSSVEPYKHHSQVIDAVALLHSEGIPVNLKLFGSANSRMLQNLKKKIQNIDPLGEFIQYFGLASHEQLQSEYFSANIFVFASSCENMPITLMEGMAAGVPVVCSDRGPMPEILGDAGVYFNPENTESIVSAIRKLIESPELRVKNTKLALEQAQKYSWSQCASETFLFLSQVLDDYKKKNLACKKYDLQ